MNGKQYLLLSISILAFIVLGAVLGFMLASAQGEGYAFYIPEGNILVRDGNLYLGDIKLSEVEGLLTLNRAILFEVGIETPNYTEGLMFYCYDDKTLTIYNDEQDVSLQIGQEQWIRVKNVEDTTIYDGQAVYVSGATTVARGGHPKVKLALSNDSTKAKVLGLATHDIESKDFGYVTTFGIARGLNTSMFSTRDALYVSDIEPGKLTAIPPEAPSFPLQIGSVIIAHDNEGKIFVTVPPTDVLGLMVIDGLTINNNLTVIGKTTLSGGVDPPFISFTAETHSSIREFALSVLEHEKIMLFWNADTNRFEIYDIAKDEFHGLYEDMLTKIAELEARIEVLEQND